MAIYRVWNGSTDATKDGSTWDKAFIDIKTAVDTVNASGHTFLVEKTHVVDYGASNTVLNTRGTKDARTIITCVDKTDDSLSDGAIEFGTQSLEIQGSAVINGMIFGSGNNTTGSYVLQLAKGAYTVIYNNCKFFLGNSTNVGRIQVGENDRSSSTYNNCGFYWQNKDGIPTIGGGCKARFNAPYLITQNSPITGLAPQSYEAFIRSYGIVTSFIEINDADFSNQPSSFMVVWNWGDEPGSVFLNRCKFPASWSGNVGPNKVESADVVLVNCTGPTDVNIRQGYYGASSHSYSVFRNGGMEGEAPYSWQCVTTASCDRTTGMEMPDFHQRVAGGSAITVTLPIVIDSATALVNGDIYMMVTAPGAVGCTAPGANATYIAGHVGAAGNTTLTASSHTWTGTSGWANEQKRQLSVTLTPTTAGWLTVSVVVTRPSTTLYVDSPVLS